MVKYDLFMNFQSWGYWFIKGHFIKEYKILKFSNFPIF
jgi:hypothetical protein